MNKLHCSPPFAVAKPIQVGDIIILEGKIKDDAKQFSVNFRMEDPSDIAYHFRTDFTSRQTVVHNRKVDGSWKHEIVENNTWIEGPGKSFSLYFFFDKNEIWVYNEEDLQYKFKLHAALDDIKYVQAFDDVEYIDEIAFEYMI